MTLCIDTKTTVIDSIDDSIREVFEMMAGVVLVREREDCRVSNRQGSSENSKTDLSVVMGLTGDLQGSLSLSLSQEAALHWTEALIDHQTSEIDDTVVDAVGELGNMVVGGAKRRLTDYSLKMSLPSVIRVGSDGITVPMSKNEGSISVGYQYVDCTISVLIALQMQGGSAS